MELFRVSRDVYGQEVLQGLSWDLLWVFLGLGLAFVAVHALYRLLLAPKPFASPPSASPSSGPKPAGPGAAVQPESRV